MDNSDGEATLCESERFTTTKDDNFPKETDFHAEDESGEDDPFSDALFQSLMTRDGVERFVNNISTQLLLEKECSWGEMLGAAPRALCSLGQCFVAATSSADLATLKLPSNGQIEQTSLRTALMDCSNLGRLAFVEAQKKMNQVSRISEGICGPDGTVQNILEDLEDDNLIVHSLQQQLDELKRSSQECSLIAKDVNAKFTAWRDYALRLRSACTSADVESREESIRLKSDMAVTQSAQAQQQEEMAAREQDVQRLKEDVNVDRVILRESLNNLPTGAALVAYDIIGTVVETGARIAKQYAIIPFSDSIIGYYKKWARPENENYAPNPIISNPDNDYGLHLAKVIYQALCDLDDCLNKGSTGPPDFGVDFNRLFGFSRQHGDDSSDVLIRTILNKFISHQSEAIYESQSMTPTPNTKKAIDILDQAIQVCQEIYAYYDNILQQRPTESVIRSWQQDISKALRDDEALYDLRRDLKEQREQQINDEKEKTSRSKTWKPSKNWATLKILRENAEMSQKRLDSSQKELNAQIERQRELERKFHETNMKLTQLNDENVTVHKLIGILGDCIYNLTDFQEHVQKLVQFFDGLELLVTDVEERHARQFVNSIDNMLKVRVDTSIKQAAMEKTKQKLKEGHYAVARELAGVYVHVSKRHIIPTIQFVENLGITHSHESDNTQLSKPDQIAQKVQEAQAEINVIAEKRRARLRKILFDDQRAIEEIEQLLIQEKEVEC
ncbi:hypothetical protein PRK78_001754 [Emydomyces testavorans]|uniref:Uncharacterized protein n=1 Tax=Emydomyces testavorans TaxID=2070801 RepID=A0AAF0DD11_9EURO|nr:hypothetical protein PRK78_001754 [Emydomyces testavorans]